MGYLGTTIVLFSGAVVFQTINAVSLSFFGLIAGALVVFGLEWLSRDIIREGRDLERQAGLTVLGTIPRAMTKS